MVWEICGDSRVRKPQDGSLFLIGNCLKAKHTTLTTP
jgi:hypothetical protein